MSKNFLKNLFVQEDEAAEINKTVEKIETAPTLPTDTGRVSAKTADSAKTKELLKNALEKEEGSEFGYVKYKRSIDSLKSIIPDEKTRYLSSFIPAQTLGFTKEKLVKTAQSAIKILERESQDFNAAMTTRLDETVGSGKKNLEGTIKSIEQKTVELQKLTEEISSLQKLKTEIETQISNDQFKVDSIKRDFEVSYQEITTEIQSDITKITSYIGG